MQLIYRECMYFLLKFVVFHKDLLWNTLKEERKYHPYVSITQPQQLTTHECPPFKPLFYTINIYIFCFSSLIIAFNEKVSLIQKRT